MQYILKQTVEGVIESQRFLNNLYKNGLTAKAVLEYTGELNEDAATKLRQTFERFGAGSQNTGKILPVPLGMKLTPLDIKLTDSQFVELKKYSALQIAAAFGIKPNQINDYEKSSYSNSEMQQLSFYVDTMLFVLKQYEEEVNYKLLSDDEVEERLPHERAGTIRLSVRAYCGRGYPHKENGCRPRSRRPCSADV